MRKAIYLGFGLTALALVGYRVLRPIPVTVARAVRGPAMEAVYATGFVEADPRVVVKSKVPGTVSELLVKEGDRVKAGQLLAKLDNKAIRYDLERTRADVRASTQRSSTSSPQLAALRAQRDSIAADLKLSESELTRGERLVERGAMASAELDGRRERVQKLKADWAAADARVASTEIDLRAERERTSAVEGAMLAQSSDTEVRAPLDGAVIRRRVELGEAVVGNQPLFTVGNIDRLILEVKIDEADVGRVRLGQEVLVDLFAFHDRVVTGKICDLYPDADRDTKTFLAKVEIAAPPPGMRSGMSAEVNIVTDRHEGVVLVPTGAVSGDNLQVVKEGKIEARKVALGLHDPKRTEIVHGLDPGEWVVLVGPKELSAGARVVPTEAPLFEPLQPRQSRNQMSER